MNRIDRIDRWTFAFAAAVLMFVLLVEIASAAPLPAKPGAFSGRAEVSQYSPGTNRPRVDLRRVRCRWNGERTVCTRTR